MEQDWIFKPRPDITAYEVALLLAKSGVLRAGVRCTDEVYRSEMPEGLKRHWFQIGAAAGAGDGSVTAVQEKVSPVDAYYQEGG